MTTEQMLFNSVTRTTNTSDVSYSSNSAELPAVCGIDATDAQDVADSLVILASMQAGEYVSLDDI